MPPLAPPNGTSTIAHLNVMSAARASTSSSFTSGEKRMPPLTGSLWWLCSALQASMTSYPPPSFRTGKRNL